MKYIIALYITIAPLFLLAQANSIDIGIFNVPLGSNTFQVRIKPNQNITGQFSGGVFTVRFPSSYGVSMGVVSSPYSYSLAINGALAGYDYYAFSMATVFNGQNWTANSEYVIATLQHSNNGNGIGQFEIVNDTWTASNNANYYMEVNLNEAQNGFYGGPASSPLPVELINFNASAQADQTVSVDWRTYAENRIANYVVEHATDGLNFKPIGNKPAKGGLNTYSDYNLIHAEPAAGNNYYRLRIVDHEGTYQYSPVRVVVFEDKNSYAKLQPNPTTGPFSLIFADENEGELTVSIHDVDGRLVKETNFITKKGANTFLFDNLNLPEGVYAITLKQLDGSSRVLQLIVVKA